MWPFSSTRSTPNPIQFKVVVYGRQGVIFEGQARALTATNDRGTFDILPMHSRFVSTFQGALTLHLAGKKNQILELQSGVIRVDQELAEVFEGI